jgi:16S rRNA G966 N2-methylase RsmD
MNTTNLVNRLKESGQDFEWYPTTQLMIERIAGALPFECRSLLDIGAGDGRVLKGILDSLKKIAACRYLHDRQVNNIEVTQAELDDVRDRTVLQLYSIEKSEILRNAQPAEIVTLGTDFYEQTLIDKQVDVVFCNPPYSDFECWMLRVIKEANAKKAYLVVPQRWNDSALIKQALKKREARARVLWSMDFLTADRKARAKVDIVEVDLRKLFQGSHYNGQDPFDLWFDEYFQEFDKAKDLDPDRDRNEKQQRLNDIVAGKNRVEHLAECYRQDMAKLCGNYRAVGQLEADILKEMGVDKKNLKESLKKKISGLKSLYWKELFDRLDTITRRLTSKSRDELLKKINSNVSVDFTESNVYSVVIWVIKNANKYFHSQLVDMFYELSSPACIKNYKSNQKVWEKGGYGFRYKAEDHSHFMLDYRIVSERYSAIEMADCYSWDFENGLHKGCHDLINDICTIGRNLGFDAMNNSYDYAWESGKRIEFELPDSKLFMDVKAFKNGNLHFRFNQDFIKTLNIEAARLLGWIHTPEEAAEETGIDLWFVRQRLGSNKQFGSNQVKALCG